MSETVHPVPEGFNAKIGPKELEALYAVADADPHCHWMAGTRSGFAGEYSGAHP